MRWLRERRVALAALTLFTLLAGDAIRYTVSWVGWGLVVAILLALWIWLAVRNRVEVRIMPSGVLLFISVVTLSILWSQYRGATILGVITTLATVFVGLVMARTITLDQLIRALSVALRWILGLSLLFEFVVATIIRQPVLPLWVTYEEPIPNAFYWSQGLLFTGERIQGIVGNANLLATVALLGLIVFTIQLVDHRVTSAAAWGWVGVAALMFLLSRSATMIAALAAVLFTLGVIVVARRTSSRIRREVYGGAVLLAGILMAVGWTFRREVLAVVERSDDLTGRLDIWDAVWQLASQRPILGWGWVSYWAPWVEPFDDLVVIDGVTYLQAHNAFIDVWLQIGAVGLTAFLALITMTVLRSASWSIDPPLGDVPSTPAARTLPMLLLMMLLVQALAESRLLIEAGMVFLIYLATASKARNQRLPAGSPPLGRGLAAGPPRIR